MVPNSYELNRRGKELHRQEKFDAPMYFEPGKRLVRSLCLCNCDIQAGCTRAISVQGQFSLVCRQGLQLPPRWFHQHLFHLQIVEWNLFATEFLGFLLIWQSETTSKAASSYTQLPRTAALAAEDQHVLLTDALGACGACNLLSKQF